MTSRRGFSLTELLIALVLSTLVLVGIIGIASQMVRFQMESGTRGGNSDWALIALDRMNKEIQNASSVPAPIPGGTSASLSGCSNFSIQQYNLTGTGKIRNCTCSAASSSCCVTNFYYCVATLSGNKNASLLRYGSPPNPSSDAACPMALPSCGSGSYDVVAQNVSPLSGAVNYFTRNNDGSVQVQFNVGAAPTANAPLATALHVNSTINMQKAYSDTAD